MKVKAHLKKHKEAYIGLGIGVLIGATGATVLIVRNPEMVAVQKVTGLVNWRPSQTVIQQSVMALSHPGFRIRNNETGAEYPSINSAAKEEGISATSLARHLHGKQSHVDGKTFSIIGLADVSHFPVPEVV